MPSSATTLSESIVQPAARSAVGSGRVLSVDIFRGLTMVVMIFVNNISRVEGMPWWTEHMPAGVNGMTYVDVVFPAFLFIVGMAIPLAVNKRLAQGDSTARLWGHILARFLGLVALGLLLANAGQVDGPLTGIGAGAWGFLGVLGALLFWNGYPRGGGPRWIYLALRFTGLLLLLAVFATFRRRLPDGSAAWLDFSYWEILGLIGRAYLGACILYVPLRQKRWAPALLLTALCAMAVASTAGWLDFLRLLPRWIWPFGGGQLPLIVMSGIVASTIFLDGTVARTHRGKALWALGYAALLFAAGWVLSPLGISKTRATPAWCLYCSAISVVLFLALYWLADVRRRTRWAALFQPAGSNTLLTYLLPYLFYFAIGTSLLATLFGSGWRGVVLVALFTVLMLKLSAALTRLGVRTQL